MEKDLKLEQHTEDSSRVQFDNPRFFPDLLGNQDEHLRVIERALRVKIAAANNTLVITGDETQRLLAGRVATQLYGLLQNGYPIYPSDVDYAIRILSRDRSANLKDIFLDTVYISAHRRTITPKSIAQKMYIDAVRRFDIVFGIGPAGTGKCIAGSSLVLTSQGLLPISTLATGTTTGNYTPVDFSIAGIEGTERASHFYDGGVSRTRRITTRLGFEIEVTPEHPLLQLQPDGTTAWQRAKILQPRDFVAIQRGQAMFGQDTAIQFTYQPNGHRDHAKPIAVDTLDEDLGYLLGLLTGDGCLTFLNRVILSSADEEILAFFSRMAERFGLHVFKNGAGRPYDRIIASAQLYQLLLHLGMTNGRAATKRVPLAVLRAPRAIVVAYLQGLFDTDGTVDRRYGYPVFCSVSKELVDQVQVLLLNFGILSSKRLKWSTYQGERRRSYTLEITGAEADRFYSEIGFRLPRKQQLQQTKPRNTNVDVVPYVNGCIQAAVGGVVLSRAVHKRLDDYKAGRRWPGYEKLGEILSLLPDTAPHPARAQRAALHAHHFFWAEITAIEEGEAHVYDLTVPGTHSFCANGFVNHNTYLAMAMAVAELMKHKVSRVVLTRPAVEAGEKLGFLPGDLAEKINPYLRPLYDALYDMVDYDRASKMIERGTIEVAPLAFMRGRTLNDSFVILDEAQNTTSEQMKMFLTRLGYGSKAVITGDVTQVDLPTGTRSGLKEAQRILRGIEGINFSFFSEKDVVRHRLVQDVIMAYERAHDEQERFEEERREQRRLRTQERFDHRHFGHGSRSESERAAHVGAHDPAPSGPDADRTQSSAGDGPNDPRPESPVSREGQSD